MLRINLLGKIKIEYLGENLEPKLSNKTVAIIYLLIANKGKYLSKDKLMLYLWPESTEDAARYNLRYNIWLLKKVLPTTAAGESLILSDKDGCILNEHYPLECDLLTIRELDCKHAGIDELLCAKQLFTGNIMEGWYLKNCNEFNESILFDRMTCESSHMEVLSTLAARYEALGEYGRALEVLKEQATMEPENEELALHIMKTYASLGNRTAAISYYRSFESTLWNSLKITPANVIGQYYEKLLDGSAAGPAASAGSAAPERGTVCENLEIHAFCIGGVDYFLLSDILSRTLRQICPSLLLEMDGSMVEDLGSISRELICAFEKAGGGPCGGGQSVPPVRIILAFSRYMELLTERYQVELQISNYQEIDAISAKVIEYLESLSLNNLTVRIA